MSEKSELLAVPGFRASGMAGGIKKNGKKDLALILCDGPASVAGLFTLNKVKAAPVLISSQRVKKGVSRGVLVNSGNANACTGKKGMDNALAMTALAEGVLGLKKGELLVCSTGVIGVPMPMNKVKAAIPKLASSFGADLTPFAQAIMTTDAYQKTSFTKARIGNKTITIAGIAKGAGMICPNMATLLSFFLTDACINTASLKKALKIAVDGSFNRIIVDNDTSTNDTALAFASKKTGPEIKAGTKAFDDFTRALTNVAVKLAHMIVRDGEGATRFIEIDLRNAASAKDAINGARTIAQSQLVKTAFFGGDPNWGRILAALGRAGIKLDESKVDISFNGVPVVRNGLDTGNEDKAAKAIKTRDVVVTINLRAGKASEKLWTTDLSYEYVKINSAYRT